MVMGWFDAREAEAFGITLAKYFRDRVPPAYSVLPGSDLVLVQPDVELLYDAAFVIECSDVERPGLVGAFDNVCAEYGLWLLKMIGLVWLDREFSDVMPEGVEW